MKAKKGAQEATGGPKRPHPQIVLGLVDVSLLPPPPSPINLELRRGVKMDNKKEWEERKKSKQPDIKLPGEG